MQQANQTTTTNRCKASTSISLIDARSMLYPTDAEHRSINSKSAVLQLIFSIYHELNQLLISSIPRDLQRARGEEKMQNKKRKRPRIRGQIGNEEGGGLLHRYTRLEAECQEVEKATRRHSRVRLESRISR